MSSPNAHEGAAPGSALPRSFSRYPGSIRSPKQTPTANSIFEDDETPLGSGIAGQLPRRNHTISSGTSRASTRRLPQHFEQPIPPTSPPAGPAGNSQSISSASPAGRLLKHHHPASPSRNSLQDILQGEDPAHEVEWEQALQDEVSISPLPYAWLVSHRVLPCTFYFHSVAALTSSWLHCPHKKQLHQLRPSGDISLSIITTSALAAAWLQVLASPIFRCIIPLDRRLRCPSHRNCKAHLVHKVLHARRH